MGISQNVCQQHDVFGRLLRNPQMVSPEGIWGTPRSSKVHFTSNKLQRKQLELEKKLVNCVEKIRICKQKKRRKLRRIELIPGNKNNH